MVSVPLTGLASSDPVPGNYIEVNFGQGPASSGANQYPIIVLANILPTGSAMTDGYVYGPDTAIPMASEADAIALAGAGSEAHRMLRRIFAVNQSSSVYLAPILESVGSKATGVITLVGTATSSATLRIVVHGEQADASIVTGDSPTVIGDSVVAAVNSKPHWGVTASNAAGTVTLTAKQKGPRGNFIRFSARALQSCGVVVSPSANATALSGGTTADSNSNVLAYLSSQRFYYVVSAAEDAAQFGAVAAQIDTMASPIIGLRQRAFAGSVDSLANAQTIATGLNKARVEVVWQPQADLTPSELAANNAAVYALFEASSVPRCNFSGFGLDAVTSQYWQVKAPTSGAIPTRNQIKSALNNGLSPIAVGKSGTSFLVKRVTSRSLLGANPDYRIRDAHKVTVSDRFADDLLTKQALQLSGKLIGDDPAKGQRIPGSNVVTPRVMKALVAQLVREYADNDLLENEEAIIANTIVVRESAPNTRMGVRVPLDIVDILDQTATAIDQTG